MYCLSLSVKTAYNVINSVTIEKAQWGPYIHSSYTTQMSCGCNNNNNTSQDGGKRRTETYALNIDINTSKWTICLYTRRQISTFQSEHTSFLLPSWTSTLTFSDSEKRFFSSAYHNKTRSFILIKKSFVSKTPLPRVYQSETERSIIQA